MCSEIPAGLSVEPLSDESTGLNAITVLSTIA